MANEKRLIELGEVLRMVQNSREDCPETSVKGRCIWETAHNCALSCLTNCDTVDAVEVVRCKECKHWTAHDNSYGECIHRHWIIEGETNAVTSHNDFCSYGERREGE